MEAFTQHPLGPTNPPNITMGPPQLPKAFTPLVQAIAKPELNVNVMGIVTDHLPAAPTRGVDWTCSFSANDDSNHEDVKVRWFGAQAQLPTVSGSGDVVLLRNVRVKSWSGMNIIMSNRASTWTVIPHASLSNASAPGHGGTVTSLRSKGGVIPSPPEVLFARYLHDSRDSSAFTAPSKLQNPQDTTKDSSTDQDLPVTSMQLPIVKRDKFSLVKDVRIKTYVDLVGQVVKMFSAMNRVELYITDYTSNPLLFHYANPDESLSDDEQKDQGFRDGDPYGHLAHFKRSRGDNSWPGPYGKQTLCVSLWPPHDEFAVQSVQPGTWVYLRNVHIKLDRSAKLEGGLHSDSRYPARVDVRLLDHSSDERCKDALRRKKAYLQNLGRNDISTAVQGKKRKAIAAFEELDDNKENEPSKLAKPQPDTKSPDKAPPPDETKQQQRKRRKREKREREAAAAVQLAASKTKGPSVPPRPSKVSLNPHIRTQNPSQPPQTLAQILSPRPELTTYTPPSGNTFHLPFSNVKYRTAPVRVIDYFPENLEQWCMRYKESEMDCLDDDDSGNKADDSSNWSSARSEGEDEESGAENGSRRGTGRGFQTQAPAASARGWSWKWHWRFALRLEDYPPPSPKGEEGCTWVFVTKRDAEFLLKLDARNLRAGEKGRKAVAQLREKMFVLWGDVEERKVKEREGKMRDEREGREGGEGKEREGGEDKERKEIEPRGLPFECCLKEYGVQRKGEREGSKDDDDDGDLGWDRRFAMFGTVIS